MSEALLIALRTAGVGAAAVAIELPLAVMIARWLASQRFPGRSLVQVLLVLPMFLPPVAVGLFLLLLLAPDGPLGWLGGRVLFRPAAAVLASAAISFPMLLRHAQEGFSAVPPRLRQVAATLGATRWQVFWRVELPLARRGIVVGALLALARAVSEFGATSVLAGVIPGRTETLATGIYARLTLGDDAGALLLAAISVALGIAAVLASEELLRTRPLAPTRP